MLRLTPEIFYGKSKDEARVAYWNSLDEVAQYELKLYQIVLENPMIAQMYLEIFNFFFEEEVVFQEECYIVLNPGASLENIAEIEDIRDVIRGVINESNFQGVVDVIAQLCGMDVEEEEREEDQHFKNEMARQIWLKLQAGRKKQKAQKRGGNKNMTLPNIISSLSGGKHPALSYLNVWGLTIYQAIDTFNRLQLGAFYDIDSTRVSVWGDEKKTFQSELWYKNEFDK